MEAISQPGIRFQPRQVILIYSAILVLEVGIVLFVRDETLRITLSDLMYPVTGLLTAGVLFYTARETRTISFRLGLAWLLLAAAGLCWALGDALWAVLEVFMKVDPFPSIADVFYLLYYPLVVVGILLMPFERPSRVERIKMGLDLGIVMLAAGLLYWNFLISPQVVFEDVDLLTILVSLAYPVFDLVMLAAFMLLLYRRQNAICLAALIFLAISILIEVVFDTIYGLQSLAGTYTSGTLLDISWQVGFITFGLAGIYQVQSMRKAEERELPWDNPGLRRRLNSFMRIFPYAFLVVSYVFLIWANYHPVTMQYHTIAVVVALMLGMVVSHQALSISETTRLSQQLHQELAERQRAEALLRKSHAELESRVEELRIAEEQLQTSVHEKEILLKEIHHRVKNNLQVIISMLKLQSSQMDEPAVLVALQDSQNRVQSMALIHEKLYRSADLAQIDFAGYLESLASFLFRSYNSAGKEVGMKIEAEPISLGIDAAMPCGLIVNELVSNALKHAFPNGKGGEVAIRLKAAGDGQIELSIADDGVGISQSIDLEHTPSLGLQLVNALVSQLDGSLELVREPGTRFTVRFASLNQ